MDLNSINANINRLLTNIWAVISFLKEFAVDGAKDVSITYINADGSESVKTMPNISKFFDDNSFGMKNYIINGGFDIWQRGTSFDSGVNYYSADRWRLFGHEAIISKSGNNIIKVKYNDTDGGDDNFVGLNQTIETKNAIKLRGKRITISALVRKGSAFEGSLVLGLGIRTDGDDLIATGLIKSKDITTEVGTNFTKVSITYDVPSFIRSIGVNIEQTNTTTINDNNYYEVSKVQLEEGSVATPFEQRPYGLELSLCQRYYEVINANIIRPTYRLQDGTASNGLGGSVFYKNEKLFVPTLDIATVTYGNCENMSFAAFKDGIRVDGNATSTTSTPYLGGAIVIESEI